MKQVPDTVELDEVLNNLGWQMNNWLIEHGAKFDGRVFNHMKPFLKDMIQQWVDAKGMKEPDFE